MTISLQDIASGKARIQSPYLYLQAAGSDGSDGSAAGVHLRWDFLRNLGDTHIPKGNMAVSSGLFPAFGGFNKSNDFVTLLRTPYDETFPVILDLRSDIPSLLVESGTIRQWKFNLMVKSAASGSAVVVAMRFTDIDKYDSIRSLVNPLSGLVNFINQYAGVVEVEVESNLCFATTLIMQQPVAATPGQLRIETISPEENLTTASLFLSSRQLFSITGQSTTATSRPIAEQIIQLDVDALLDSKKIKAENIRYFRFDYRDCFPVQFEIETYKHFIEGKIFRNQWSTVGSDFALSLDDTTVFKRLEDSSFVIDRRWPKYAGANQGTGLYTVLVNNYKERWKAGGNGEEGLKDLLQQYLELSRNSQNLSGNRVFHPQRLPNDSAAIDSDEDYVFTSSPIPASHTIDEGATSFDSLTMIKLISSDYHVARMFGLGYIDPTVGSDDTSYIYITLYETTAALETGQLPVSAVHVSMSMPTSMNDFRLPQPPVLNPLTFGFKGATGSTRSITDVNGYVPNAAVRIINLLTKDTTLGDSFKSFFETTELFTTDNITLPIWYGVKYKKSTDADWNAPELSNDADYKDYTGVNESLAVISNNEDTADDNVSVFVHTEENAGIHQYSIYGINWFSRVSTLSNIQETETVFSIIDIATLLPPLNFAAQFIQNEDPLIFTTTAEQDLLQSLITANPSGDHTLIRVTFDWNHVQNNAHQWANKVQFFFRQQSLRIIKGEIKSITEITDELVEVRTKGYSTYSTTEIQVEDAKVLTGDEIRFKGSLFATEKNQFVVSEVVQSSVAGEGSIFRLKKVVEASAQDIDNNDSFVITDDFILPEVSARFFVTENLAEAANWTDNAPGVAQPLQKEITLVKFSEHQETVIEYDGTSTILNAGGIYESSSITEFEDVNDEGVTIPGSRTGVYEIHFDSYSLQPHPDADTSWYRGIARIKLAGSNEVKVLSVIDIGVHSGGLLKIIVTDPEGAAATDVIPTGAGVYVNFHPSYRVYLKTQPNVLTSSTTLPAQGQRVKQTLMGARSMDSTIGASSSVGTPGIMLTREIIVPLPPQQPTGAAYATRPDFYGKATYTFETVVNTSGGRKPYVVVFYRANERSVLDVLYLPATVANILSDLDSLSIEDDAFYFDRYRDLVNVNLAPDGKFKQYISGGYRFPNPDNVNYIVPNPNLSAPAVKPFVGAPNPGTIVSSILVAIESIFFPLTEQPIFYSAIKTGRVTSNRKPVIKNSNGDFLLPTDTAYDPAPMAVILPNTNTIRFTDYTLDGSAKNIYFYYAKELNDLFQFSDKSPILGPIRLVNTLPPEEPVVKKVMIQVEDDLSGVVPGVKVNISPYLAAENIKQLQLYRTTNVADKGSVRSMKLVKTVDIDTASAYTIVDEFDDLNTPPFGDPIYYRVVALRLISNEKNESEYVPSLPSKVMMATIIDVKNPVAPTLTVNIGTDTGFEFQDVTLLWNRTTYNGTYYLYKMTSTGNWFRLFQISTNDETISYLLPDNLAKLDNDDTRIYYRFKVDVENSSGLLNLEENPFVL